MARKKLLDFMFRIEFEDLLLTSFLQQNRPVSLTLAAWLATMGDTAGNHQRWSRCGFDTQLLQAST
jgi:hypothetical protein